MKRFFRNRRIDEAEIVEAFRPIAARIALDVEAAVEHATAFARLDMIEYHGMAGEDTGGERAHQGHSRSGLRW